MIWRKYTKVLGRHLKAPWNALRDRGPGAMIVCGHRIKLEYSQHLCQPWRKHHKPALGRHHKQHSTCVLTIHVEPHGIGQNSHTYYEKFRVPIVYKSYCNKCGRDQQTGMDADITGWAKSALLIDLTGWLINRLARIQFRCANITGQTYN